jgi:hypothetical protein
LDSDKGCRNQSEHDEVWQDFGKAAHGSFSRPLHQGYTVRGSRDSRIRDSLLTVPGTARPAICRGPTVDIEFKAAVCIGSGRGRDVARIFSISWGRRLAAAAATSLIFTFSPESVKIPGHRCVMSRGSEGQLENCDSGYPPESHSSIA